MKYFSAFTGVGGFELGVPEEWECAGFSEIDKDANKVLKYRYPEVKNYGDIEKIDYGKLPDFEILVGGSPCQDISVAGKGAGLAGIRSRLFYSYVAILKSKRPDYFIFENVKNILSSNGGWDFAEVINQFSNAGYNVWWQVLDAQWFGIPQHRERVFIFGTLGEKSIRKVFLEPANSRQNKEIQEKKNSETSGKTENRKSIPGMGDGGGISIPVVTHLREGQNGRGIKCAGEPSFTLQRAQKAGVFDGKRIRFLTPLECERLMGWEDGWTKYGMDDKGNIVELSDNARYKLIGNGVVPDMVKSVINIIMEEKNIGIVKENPVNSYIIKPTNKLKEFEIE